MTANNETLALKMRIIAANVQERRLELNYTQEYVGRKLSISQNAYSKMERGESKITVERLLQIAAILDCDVKEFLHMKEKLSINYLRQINLRAKTR
jgi:transcriptional regulator with XRE-family HTH domain